MENNQKQSQSFADKWTPAIEKFGYTSLPNLLLSARKKLRISAGEMLVILAIESFRWDQRKPFPSLTALGLKTGLTVRSVRRHITDLERKGIIKRVRRSGTSNAYDLSPLINVLDRVAQYYLEPSKPIPKSLRDKVIYHRTKLSYKEDPSEKDTEPKFENFGGEHPP